MEKINYRGFEIIIKTIISRFGLLFTATNNIGEPYLDDHAFDSRYKAIKDGKKDIDIYLSEDK